MTSWGGKALLLKKSEVWLKRHQGRAWEKRLFRAGRRPRIGKEKVRMPGPFGHLENPPSPLATFEARTPLFLFHWEKLKGEKKICQEKKKELLSLFPGYDCQ